MRVLLAALIAAVTAQTIPDFPDEFTTTIEANFPGRGYSLVQEEAWDYANQRVRFDGFEGNQTKREYFFFNENKKVTILDGRDCNVTEIPHDGSVQMMAKDGSLNHARAMFEQVAASEYNFRGYEDVRGINCSNFEAPGQTMNTFGPGPYNHIDFAINYWWSAESWNYRGEPVAPRPVRCMVQGTMICTNHTTCTDQPFQNFYEFTRFIEGTPDTRHFEIHPWDACPLSGPAVQKPIPDFPDEFSTTIEANFVARNRSIEMREFWDYAGNRVRMDFYDSRRNQTTRDFFFFDIGQQLVVTEDDCTVRPTVGGFQRLMEEGHLVHARSMFERVPAENYTYLGQRHVRGIPCDRFSAVIANEEIPQRPSRGNSSSGPPNPYDRQTYTISWYFSDPSWDGGVADDLVTRPIRCHVEGTQFCAAGSQNCTDFEFENYYEFTNFVGGTPEGHYFDIHERYECPYYLPVNKTGFPDIPNDYSMLLEVQDEVGQTTTRVREYYDYSGNRMRLERDLPDGSSVVTVVLADEKKVVTSVDGSSCETNGLDEFESFDEYMTNFDQAGHLRPTTSVLFGLVNYSWVGRKEARGYECDVYEGSRTQADEGNTTSSIKQRIYFAVPTWTIAGDQKENRAPIRVELKGTDGDGEPSTEIDEHWEIVDYEADRPDAAMFLIGENGCPQFMAMAGAGGDNDDDEDEGKFGLVPLIGAGVGGLLIGGGVGYCATKVLSNPPLLESDEYLSTD